MATQNRIRAALWPLHETLETVSKLTQETTSDKCFGCFNIYSKPLQSSIWAVTIVTQTRFKAALWPSHETLEAYLKLTLETVSEKYIGRLNTQRNLCNVPNGPL